ncbi:fumarylacetoacetate hydrolase family protein [Aspergillus niger]|uniref:Fumarylacetoacetate hydrolase family protein n=1 Tax=Aspergillus niger TaxID=5061 RepID=A0A117E2Z2_ASPNG|nr:fumarylacetoacetate hydrolase family protein [Aspergillus niger]
MNNTFSFITHPEYSPGYLPPAQLQRTREGGQCKDAKKVSTKNALDYVLGYTAGNNLSGRKFQLPEASGDQLSYAKSFDQFAPIGRVLITSQEVQGPQQMSRSPK